MPSIARSSGVAVILLLTSLACGTTRTAPGSVGTRWFPLESGGSWLYDVETAAGPLELRVAAVGERVLPGGENVYVVEETLLSRSERRDVAPEPALPAAFIRQDGYIARYSAIDYDRAGGLRVLGQDAPTRLLPVDPQPGATWVQRHRVFATAQSGGATFEWQAEIRRVPAVTVPAGTFDDVLEVILQTKREGRSIEYRDTYALDVGLIRSRTLDPEAGHRVIVDQKLRRRGAR